MRAVTVVLAVMYWATGSSITDSGPSFLLLCGPLLSSICWVIRAIDVGAIRSKLNLTVSLSGLLR